MRQWCEDDLKRWGDEICREELSYQNQLEIVAYTADMYAAYMNVCEQLALSRARLELLARPIVELVGLASVIDEIDDAGIAVAGLKYWASQIEMDIADLLKV